MANNNGDASAGGIYLYEGQPDVPKDVTHVRFHPSVREIPEGAFEKCKDLHTVELNDGLEIIGKSAFESCYKLESVALPPTVRQICDEAFAHSGLETIVLPPLIESIAEKTFFGCEQLKSVELNEGLQTISGGAFAFCDLQSISFPSTLERIGMTAFLESGLRAVVLNEGLKTIDCGAFSKCSRLETAAIPSTVKAICAGAFEDCRDLKSARLSAGLEVIDYDAFKGCTSLERIRFPPTMEIIWKDAFAGCSTLKSVELLEDEECQRDYVIIGKGAFAGCESLLSFRLPNVKSGEIKRGAFRSCPHLRNIILGTEMGQAPFNRAFTSLYFIDYSFDDLLKRFNNMPIHDLCHYRSNIPTDPSVLRKVVDESLSSRHQDCLGMTPLHILACSCNTDLDLYKVVVEKFPSYLVTKDKWGEVPLYYALVGEAPMDTLQFLLRAHREIWGGLPFDLSGRVKQLSNSKGTTINFMHRLFEAQRAVFPDLVLGLESIVVGEDTARKVLDKEKGSYAEREKASDLLWSVLIASFSERIRKNECLPPISETVAKYNGIVRSCASYGRWGGGPYFHGPLPKLVKYADTIWKSMARWDDSAFSDPDLAWKRIVDNLCFFHPGGIYMPIRIYQDLVRASLAHRLGHIQHRAVRVIEAMIAAMPDHTLETDFLMGDYGGKERFERALRSHVQSIRSRLLLYELHEAASILELALWKAQIETDNGEAQNQEVDRAACRVRCGADVVVTGVLAYLKG